MPENLQESTQQHISMIESALIRDKEEDNNLGKVYCSKSYQSGKPDAQLIMDELDARNYGQFYNHIECLQTLFGSRDPKTPIYAIKTIKLLNGLRKRHPELDEEESSRNYLDRIVEKCESIARNLEIQSQTENKNEKAFNQYIKVPGIYAYSFEHYLKHRIARAPCHDEDEFTYIKVGVSGTDALQRVKNQRTTAMPEHPKLLYIFVNEENNDLELIEKKIHSHLAAIGHDRPSNIGGGSEWFLTNEETLKSTASLLGLDIRFDYERSDESDEDLEFVSP